MTQAPVDTRRGQMLWTCRMQQIQGATCDSTSDQQAKASKVPSSSEVDSSNVVSMDSEVSSCMLQACKEQKTVFWKFEALVQALSGTGCRGRRRSLSSRTVAATLKPRSFDKFCLSNTVNSVPHPKPHNCSALASVGASEVSKASWKGPKISLMTIVEAQKPPRHVTSCLLSSFERILYLKECSVWALERFLLRGLCG